MNISGVYSLSGGKMSVYSLTLNSGGKFNHSGGSFNQLSGSYSNLIINSGAVYTLSGAGALRSVPSQSKFRRGVQPVRWDVKPEQLLY